MAYVPLHTSTERRCAVYVTYSAMDGVHAPLETRKTRREARDGADMMFTRTGRSGDQNGGQSFIGGE